MDQAQHFWTQYGGGIPAGLLITLAIILLAPVIFPAKGKSPAIEPKSYFANSVAVKAFWGSLLVIVGAILGLVYVTYFVPQRVEELVATDWHYIDETMCKSVPGCVGSKGHLLYEGIQKNYVMHVELQMKREASDLGAAHEIYAGAYAQLPFLLKSNIADEADIVTTIATSAKGRK